MKKGVDYTGVTVCMYCHDSKGNMLLQKRSMKCRDEQGRWDCGGGALEFGETFEEAARREIREEYCCEVEDIQFVGVNNVIRESNGVKTHWVAIIFSVLLDPEKVKIGDQDAMSEIGWFTLDNLPSPLHSKYLEHLEFVKKANI
jgi:8-oxo-dGTP diphosphatase